MSQKNSQQQNYFKWHFVIMPKRILTVTNNFIEFYSRFFSISQLLKTFLTPWHKIIEVKQYRGFNLEKTINRLVGNLFSSFIGVLLRTLVIIVWILLTLETAVFGVVLVIIWLFFPFATLPLYLDYKSRPNYKHLKKKEFIKNHSLTKKTTKYAENWFTRFWRNKTKRFWHKDQLALIHSPTASWHFGYTPHLDKYSKDFSEKVNILDDQIIGRDKELDQLTRTLSRKTQPDVILYGPTGSGRHAIVYELSRRIRSDDWRIPQQLKHFRVVKLDTMRLTPRQRLTPSDETKVSSSANATLNTAMAEAEIAGNIILVLDEIHNLTKYLDLIAPIAQRGKIKIIGLTTTKNYQLYLQKNELAKKIFETISIQSLSAEITLDLLENKAIELEKKYKTIYPIESLQRIIQLGNQAAGSQPDASLDLIEEIALASNKGSTFVKDRQISPTMVNSLAEEKLKIPLASLGPGEKRKLSHLEELLHEYVINQNEAINSIADALRRARLKLDSPNRPLSSFLFLGPTGVGKTETAKALARVYFTGKRLTPSDEVKGSAFYIRFDMSNFQNKQDTERLIRQLSNKITQTPYAVLLLDEIEKSHPDLLNLFLSIIDEGYFNDFDGDETSCRNLFIIGTSNAPSVDTFSPEFVNRFDGIITFQPLYKQDLVKIVRLKLEQLNTRLNKEHNTSIKITEGLIGTIIEEGYNPKYGAREINRAIQKVVESPLAKKLLEE